MPIWGWFCIGSFIAFVYLFAWSLCVVAGNADDAMDRMKREEER